VARTDSKALYGLDDALTRIKLYEEAGADMVFVDALETRTEMKAVPRAVRKPAMITFIPGGKTSRLTKAEAEELGYKMFVLALIPLYAAASAMVETCDQIFQGNPEGKGFPRLTFREFNSLIGIDAYQKLVKTQP
jgi:2-methylisocitrate lyase-like PEP mutase family enzyme